jgi:hypothetical protein
MPDERGTPRRPGPIGFHAEAKVTTQRHGPGSNEGGMGDAVGPTRETPSRSQPLRVSPTGLWAAVGAVVVLTGIVLLSPLVIACGLLVEVGAFFANRANRTESRLREQAFKGGA